MKYHFFLMILLYSCYACAQSPGNIPGFTSWLKSDQRKNFSELGRLKAGSFNTRSYSATSLMNYNPAIQFDGKHEGHFFPIVLNGLSQATIFVVYQDGDPGTETTVWKLNGAFGEIQLTTQQVLNTDDSLSFYSEKFSSPVINTYIKNWKTRKVDTYEDEGLLLGPPDRKTGAFKGKIAEYILYDRVLKLSEQQKIESSLALTYGISLAKNYISSRGRITWDHKENIAHSQHITGIGKDGSAALYQKQSISSDPHLYMTISAGGLATSNLENSTIINDHDYIIFGDNNGKLELENPEETLTGIPLLERKWVMQVSGETSHLLPTELNLNAASLFTKPWEPGGSYILVIDRSADGNFSNDHTEYIRASEISSDGILKFDNIFWDTDRSGKDLFSFSYLPALEASLIAAVPLSCDHEKKNGSIILKASGGVKPYRYQLLSLVNDYALEIQKNENEWRVNELGSGRYQLKVTDKTGHSVIDTLSVVSPLAVKLALPEKLDLNAGESIVLDAAGQSSELSVSYEWQGPDGMVVIGSLIQIFTPGIYKVHALGSMGCEASYQVEIISTENREQIVLYPNPSSDGRFNLDIRLGTRAPVQIQIFDISNRLVGTLSGKEKDRYMFTDRINGSAGLYTFLIETTPGKTIVRRLMIR